MVQFFGHSTGQTWDDSLAGDSPNGTGMTTLQDYIAGTNPMDPNSVFEAEVVPPPPVAGGIVLTWIAEAGRTYSVQYKDNLTDPVWQTLSGAPTIVGSQGQMTVPTDSTEPLLSNRGPTMMASSPFKKAGFLAIG